MKIKSRFLRLFENLCTNAYFYNVLFSNLFEAKVKRKKYFRNISPEKQNAMPGWCSIIFVVLFYLSHYVTFYLIKNLKNLSRFLKKIYKKAPNVQILFIFPLLLFSMVFEPAKKLIKLFEIIPLCQIQGFEENRQAQNWYISATL